MAKKCPKKSKFFILKYIKVLEFKKKPKTFLSKGTKDKKKCMEGLSQKIKNIKRWRIPLITISSCFTNFIE